MAAYKKAWVRLRKKYYPCWAANDASYKCRCGWSCRGAWSSSSRWSCWWICCWWGGGALKFNVVKQCWRLARTAYNDWRHRNEKHKFEKHFKDRRIGSVQVYFNVTILYGSKCWIDFFFRSWFGFPDLYKLLFWNLCHASPNTNWKLFVRSFFFCVLFINSEWNMTWFTLL